jgi:hypothetical protein
MCVFFFFFFLGHLSSYKYTKKASKKLLIFFLVESIFTREALIHLMLISVVNNMRNFVFWTIMTSFRKKITYDVCFLTQFSKFSK